MFCDTYCGGIDEATLFDLASATKIMGIISLAFIALDNGLLKLDDTMDKFYLSSSAVFHYFIGHNNIYLEKNMEIIITTR